MNADIKSFETFMAHANHVSPERVHPFLSLLICVHPLPEKSSFLSEPPWHTALRTFRSAACGMDNHISNDGKQ
jgi:hypothetical protein